MPDFIRRRFLQTAAAAAMAPAIQAAAKVEEASWAEALGAKLERGSRGAVVAADFTSTWIADPQLAKIADWKELERLTLAKTRITDLGLEHLRPLQNVRVLDCWYAEHLTEDGIRRLGDWPKLEKLVLRGTRVSSRVLETTARMLTLRHLDVAFTDVSDEGFEQLAALPKLERLCLGGNRMAGDCLDALEPLTPLRHLDAGGVQRVDSGLWGLPLTLRNIGRIALLTRLEGLDLRGATLSDRGLDRPGHALAERKEMRQIAGLAPLVNLRWLDLGRLPISSADLQFLSGLKKLEELQLTMAPNVGDEAIPHLLAAPSLRRVHLGGAAITDQGLLRLAESRQLRHLVVGGTAVTAQAVKEFRKKRPDCELVWWPKTIGPSA